MAKEQCEKPGREAGFAVILKKSADESRHQYFATTGAAAAEPNL
jgi:hypothetical protein